MGLITSNVDGMSHNVYSPEMIEASAGRIAENRRALSNARRADPVARAVGGTRSRDRGQGASRNWWPRWSRRGLEVIDLRPLF